MTTSFDTVVKDILAQIGATNRIQTSIRAKSHPAIGLERSGPAFDYLFLTPDAICFLQPNPAPPLLVRLPAESVTEMEWNRQFLFITPLANSDIEIVEAQKGLGRRVKKVTSKQSPAKDFFDLWTRWELGADRVEFADDVARMAGLSRHEEPELGVVSWTALDKPDPDTAKDPDWGEEGHGDGSEESTSYDGVSDLINQKWLVEVVNGTVVRALNITIRDWNEDDLGRVLVNGQLDPEKCRSVMDDYLDTQEEVDDGLRELRVSEFGLAYEVKDPDK